MRILKIIFLVVIISLLYTPTVFANSAEPPSLVVRLHNAPKDTVVSIKETRESGKIVITKGKYRQFNGVNYYVFYEIVGPLLLIEQGSDSFIIETPPGTAMYTYETYVDLDFEARTATVGDRSIRSGIFVVLRVSITLIIEGVIFWLYGFRDRRSWIVFLVANLITQTALNIAINHTITPFWSYTPVMLVTYETIIIFIEIFIFKMLITEKKPTFMFVVVANFLSWHIGGWMLAMLPL